jgi:hypothetical protein
MLQKQIPESCKWKFDSIAKKTLQALTITDILVSNYAIKEERRMLTMDNIHDIRFRFFKKGENVSQIATALHLDWKTVQKYVDMKDFNLPAPKPASERRSHPKLDPYKPTMDNWLEEDKQAPRKQRHTARRVYNRLLNEVDGFNCSYRTVASYYAVKHDELFNGSRDGFLPLQHYPGESQADFGAAEFYENGMKYKGKYL